ncbi:phosphopyruvate hydratase [Arthrobacter sp. UYCu511]|nr:enolase C-terminal domain-like protein [Arthrobacter sp. lap29]
MEWGSDVYHALARVFRGRGLATGLGDEGGYAPEIARLEEALDLILAAIEASGRTAGETGIMIALDPAANSFFADGAYRVNDQVLTPEQMTDYYGKLLDNYPIRRLEDPLSEDDRQSWPALVQSLGARVPIVGDDLFVTQAARVRDGIAVGSATAVLIKPNQVGTVTETLETMTVAKAGGFTAMVSHRSGETLDSFVADLTVGSGCGQLKSGPQLEVKDSPNTIDCWKLQKPTRRWLLAWRPCQAVAEWLRQRQRACRSSRPPSRDLAFGLLLP